MINHAASLVADPKGRFPKDLDLPSPPKGLGAATSLSSHDKFRNFVGQEVCLLEEAVRTFLPHFKGDYSRESLRALDGWFSTKLHQLHALHGEAKIASAQEYKELVLRVGVYLGETLRRDCPDLEWSIVNFRGLIDSDGPVLYGKRLIDSKMEDIIASPVAYMERSWRFVQNTRGVADYCSRWAYFSHEP